VNVKCATLWESVNFANLIFLHSPVHYVNMCMKPLHSLCETSQESMCQLYCIVHCCIVSTGLCVIRFIVIRGKKFWSNPCKCISYNFLQFFFQSISAFGHIFSYGCYYTLSFDSRSGLVSHLTGNNKCAKCPSSPSIF
jgi:hypothetical protein